MTYRVVSTLTSGRVSGVDTFAVHLTRGLIKQGIDARIVLTETDECVPDPMPLPSDVPIEHLPITRGERRAARRARLAQLLESMAPSIYIPNYDYNNSVVSSVLSPRVAVVGIVHSDDPMHYDHVDRLGRFWNSIVAVSRRIEERIKARRPSLANRVRTIPYGIESPQSLPAVRPDRDCIELCYVGRLEHPQKRVLDQVRILDRLEELGVSVRLRMVGAGDARRDLERAGQKHLVAGRLVLMPPRSNQEVKEILAESDIFLLTSGFEGLPVSLLEAMSLGCVPIASDIESGVPELIESGKNGYRVQVGAINEFAQSIALLSRERDRLRMMSAAAGETIRKSNFHVDRMVERYISLFEELMSGRSSYKRPIAWPLENRFRRSMGKWGRRFGRLWRKLGRHIVPEP